jgi:hypothetical protein
MNFLSNLLGNFSGQVYIYLALVFGGFSAGFYVEHLRFDAYQVRVEVAGKAQEAKNEQILKEQQVTTERITNDYKNNIARIHTYYSGVHLNPSSSAMSVTSTTVPFIDGTPSDPQFIEKCAMTTQQLESLQEWIREQVGIK